MSERFISWVDTETTGLDAGHHEIIEIAIIRTTLQLQEVWRWQTKVAPAHIDRAHPKALEINGYTPEAWAGAPSQAEVMRHVARGIAGTMIGGHNVQFDIDFIRAAWMQQGIPQPWLDPRKSDTVGMAAPLLFCGYVPDLKLTTLTTALGIPHGEAHTAMADVLGSLNVARTLRSWLPLHVRNDRKEVTP